MTRQLRLVIFSQSIISDIGNPQATTVRAMCQAFAEAGHDVTHLEQRGNPVLMRMLKTRGYAPMRAFNERYPMIRYRQYDLLAGAERAVWFGREIATADAVIAYPGTPGEVLTELEARDTANVLRFWLGAEGALLELMPFWTDPAVLPRSPSLPSDKRIVVAYDNIPSFESTGWDRVCLGIAVATDWPFLPEALVEDHYQCALSVAMDDAVDLARALLPVANGATTELVNLAGTTTLTINRIPAENDARQRAGRLAAEIDRLLGERIKMRA